MKQMIKIELERALKGMAFKVSLIIGMLIVTIQFINVGLHNALNPLEFFSYGGLQQPYNVFYTWIGGSFNIYYTVYIRILPIMVVLPYAATYYTDRRQGIIRNYYSRTNKINYLVAKLIAVFTIAYLQLCCFHLCYGMMGLQIVWQTLCGHVFFIHIPTYIIFYILHYSLYVLV